MKAMHYDFENVGGLLQVIAVPPASFVQIRKDYAAGLNYLELRNREDIVSIPVHLISIICWCCKLRISFPYAE